MDSSIVTCEGSVWRNYVILVSPRGKANRWTEIANVNLGSILEYLGLMALGQRCFLSGMYIILFLPSPPSTSPQQIIYPPFKLPSQTTTEQYSIY